MYTIEGSNVDLITPFPTVEFPRIYGWAHCYHTLGEDDLVPSLRDEFTSWITPKVTQAMSAGMIDKSQLTSDRHEAPLVGLITLSTRGLRDADLQWASGRKAFKMGLTEDALVGFIRATWLSLPDLQRITCTLDETNTPAKGLLRRLGFRFEGVTRGATLVKGTPRNQVVFGLLRVTPGEEESQDGYTSTNADAGTTGGTGSTSTGRSPGSPSDAPESTGSDSPTE